MRRFLTTPSRANRDGRPDKKIRKHCLAIGALLNGHADPVERYVALHFADDDSLQYRLSWLLRSADRC